MFGFSKDPAPGKRKKKRSNLEFDFITGPAPSSRPASVKKAPPLTAEPKIEREPEESFPKEPTPTFSAKTESVTQPSQFSTEPEEPDFTEADSEPVRETQPPKEEPPRMTSPFSEPAPIRPTESIRRQKKEQSAVNTMLNGVVISIICAILIITVLAGTGSYVLWKQIQGQSATIALLESKTNSRFDDVQQTLADQNKKLADALAMTNDQILDLNRQLAEAQKTINALRQGQAQLQKRIDSQDATIATIRTRQIVR